MILPAQPSDHKRLTEISFSAKRHWNYPEEHIEIWNDELTISQKYIEENRVFCYLKDTEIIAYYSLVELKEPMEFKDDTLMNGLYLEHMYILSPFIGKGIGKKMFTHLQSYLKNNDIPELYILSDPNSLGFYEKMDCKFIRKFPSNIEGRTTPYLKFTLS